MILSDKVSEKVCINYWFAGSDRRDRPKERNCDILQLATIGHAIVLFERIQFISGSYCDHFTAIVFVNIVLLARTPDSSLRCMSSMSLSVYSAAFVGETR